MLLVRQTAVSPIPVEIDWLAPDRLLGKSAAEVARLPVLHGNASIALGEMFQVGGDPSDGEVVIEGDCTRVKRLGANMKSGKLTVHGGAGMHLGADMTGGEIHVHGDADDGAGAEMHGGRIHIRGNAGHLLGACYRGAAVGMRGGEILVEGNAGHEIGAGMRRGTIAVGGSVGDFAGMSMLAGTILVFGRAGRRLGAGMKRGAIVVFGEPPALLPTFRYDCTCEPVVLRIYLRQLRAWGFPIPDKYFAGVCRRYGGDRVALGKGEVLHWRESASPTRDPEPRP
jgi:formylmethanofuran dehydrogenase subunit C